MGLTPQKKFIKTVRLVLLQSFLINSLDEKKTCRISHGMKVFHNLWQPYKYRHLFDMIQAYAERLTQTNVPNKNGIEVKQFKRSV